ncbi:MAG: hypothetical protein M1476_04545 [Candidatus Thermoplasmatota archaeon]|nr:hypothetical protein [Candidatus Thermoplasmatota archaeon]
MSDTFFVKTPAGYTSEPQIIASGTNIAVGSSTISVVDNPSFVNITYSGSINMVPGPGIAFDGKTITNIGTLAAGTIQAGPGLTFVGATIVNTATVIPGPGVTFAGGSTLVNTGTLAPGTEIGISGGVVSNLSPLSGLVAGSGLGLSGTTMINASPLSGLAAGPGLSLSGTTMTNTSPLSGLVAGTGLSLSGTTITNAGIISASAGSGISVSGANPLTIGNTGVLSLQGSTGALSLAAGSGIGISGLTVSNTGVLSLGGSTGALNLAAGSGISVSGLTVSNTGVLSFNGRTGAVVPVMGDYVNSGEADNYNYNTTIAINGWGATFTARSGPGGVLLIWCWANINQNIEPNLNIFNTAGAGSTSGITLIDTGNVSAWHTGDYAGNVNANYQYGYFSMARMSGLSPNTNYTIGLQNMNTSASPDIEILGYQYLWQGL